MLDFQVMNFIKYNMVANEVFADQVEPLLTEDEKVISSYRRLKDGVIFTNKRIITIDVRGYIGNKKDYLTLPYKNIQACSVSAKGPLDMDSELHLWMSGIGEVTFEFLGKTNVPEIYDIIISYVLK